MKKEYKSNNIFFCDGLLFKQIIFDYLLSFLDNEFDSKEFYYRF